MSLTETWHDEGFVAFFQLRRQGFTVIDCPRPPVGSAQSSSLHSNHGGLAVISTSIQLRLLNIDFKSTTFEYLATKVYLRSKCINLLTIYRTGPVRKQFFSELSELLSRFVINSSVLFITGDLNIHLERHDYPNNVTLRGILSSLGLGLRVDGPTHDLGGTLDVVLQKENCHQCVVVERVDTGLSDHRLLLWNTIFPCTCPPVNSCHVRGWRRLDMTKLIQKLSLSVLCGDPGSFPDDVDEMADFYNSTLVDVVNSLLPNITSRPYRYKQPWFDVGCRWEK